MTETRLTCKMSRYVQNVVFCSMSWEQYSSHIGCPLTSHIGCQLTTHFSCQLTSHIGCQLTGHIGCQLTSHNQ